MKVSEKVSCEDFPCADVVKGAYIVPGVEIDPLKIRAIMISEAAPASASDYYYAEGEPLFKKTMVQAFQDAGLSVRTIDELLDHGFYFTHRCEMWEARVRNRYRGGEYLLDPAGERN